MNIKKGDQVQITKGPFKGRIGICRSFNAIGTCCISNTMIDEVDDSNWLVFGKPETLGLQPLASDHE